MRKVRGRVVATWFVNGEEKTLAEIIKGSQLSRSTLQFRMRRIGIDAGGVDLPKDILFPVYHAPSARKGRITPPKYFIDGKGLTRRQMEVRFNLPFEVIGGAIEYWGSTSEAAKNHFTVGRTRHMLEFSDVIPTLNKSARMFLGLMV